MVITVPWPPSINHYWKKSGNRFYISKEGIYYRVAVSQSAAKFRNHFHEDDKISINIEAFPPDNRRRDLDNVLKSLLDALQHAEVYKDDNQIDDLHIVRCNANEGKLILELTKI